MQHGWSQDLRVGLLSKENVDLTAYTLSNRAGQVLWSGTSWVDSSAHSFACIWADDSRNTVLLDRPNRGEVEITLVRTGEKISAMILPTQELIHQVLTGAKDTDELHLEKQWCGDWRFRHGRFEGVVIVAKSRYYRLHLSVDPSAATPDLHLLDMRQAEDWDDAWEKLK